MTFQATHSLDSREMHNEYATQMEWEPSFYDWVLTQVNALNIDRSAAILDIGCGTGQLLRLLSKNGFTALSGIDFSPRCLSLASKNAPSASLAEHDIEQQPVEGNFDLIFMTVIIDFLADPERALRNAAHGLNEGGQIVVTFRNLYAYWPLYYLRPLIDRLPTTSRAGRWARWFMLPLPMRREWPHERIYTSRQARSLLTRSGLSIERVATTRPLPMFDVPGSILSRVYRSVVGKVGRLMPSRMSYIQLFVCSPDDTGSERVSAGT